MDGVEPLDKVVTAAEEVRVMVRRISEPIQTDEALMAALRRVGALPDKVVTAVAARAEGVLLGVGRRDRRDRPRGRLPHVRPPPLRSLETCGGHAGPRHALRDPCVPDRPAALLGCADGRGSGSTWSV